MGSTWGIADLVKGQRFSPEWALVRLLGQLRGTPAFESIRRQKLCCLLPGGLIADGMRLAIERLNRIILS